MAWTEKLPSGRYRGMYRLPSGERRSAGTYPHKKAANDAAIEAEGKTKRAGWRDPRVGQTTWSEWYDIWWPSRVIEPSTKKSETSLIQHYIRPRWGDVALADIKRHDVQTWILGLLAENVGTEKEPRYRATSTARRILNSLVSSLTAAVDAEVLIANPALRIKLPPAPSGRQVFLTREQYAAVSSTVTNRQHRAILDMLVGTGIRWGELAGLHLHNLDLDGGYITVRDVTDGKEIKPYPKGRRPRRIPLLQWMVDYLDVPDAEPCGLPHRGVKGGRCPSGLVFRTRFGNVYDDRTFTARVLRPALERAGIDGAGVTLHDLRHTYASWLVQDGIPMSRVAELLGHASVVTTEIYAHFAPTTSSDIERAMRSPRGANVGQTAATSSFPGLHAITP